MFKLFLMAMLISFAALNSFANDSLALPANSSAQNKSIITEDTKNTREVNSVNTTSNNVGIIKDIFHIMFFISMSVIAVLSYKQAKKTVFSPIKTEVFKYQLQAFESVIGHFQNKGEIELKNDMDVDNIININSFELFNAYVQTFMADEVKINQDLADEQRKMARGAVVSKEFAEEYFELVGADAPVITKNEEPNDPALKLAKWNGREYGMVHFTEAYSKSTDEIKRFQNSPLLPSELKKLLGDYCELMHESLLAVGKAIEDAGKEMPTKFPNSELLSNFDPRWIGNIHNDKTPKLESKAIEILEFVNSYLGIDKLAGESV